VQHTVLEQGKGKKLKVYQRKDKNITSLEYALRPQLFLRSVNENVGDSLHSLHAYHDIPRYSVYRAGKYIGVKVLRVEPAPTPCGISDGAAAGQHQSHDNQAKARPWRRWHAVTSLRLERRCSLRTTGGCSPPAATDCFSLLKAHRGTKTIPAR